MLFLVLSFGLALFGLDLDLGLAVSGLVLFFSDLGLGRDLEL